MSSIFNYQTFDVRLEKSTRSLWVNLCRSETNYFSREFLFEFETLLAWCTGKVEINSIIIQGRNKRFSEGIDLEILKSLNAEKLNQYLGKLQTINFSLMHLPQVVIADMGYGCSNLGSELITACDIRLGHKDAQISFDHAKLGIIPATAGISQLSLVAGQANARNWLLSGSQINMSTLKNSGFVFADYSEETRSQTIENLLQDITAQGSVQRIQTKMGVTEHIREKVEEFNQLENKLSKAAMISEDWKETVKMPAKHMQEAVKLSLVKNEEQGLN